MLPRPFPFPFLGNRAASPAVAQGTGLPPMATGQFLPPGLGTPQAIVGFSPSPPASGIVFSIPVPGPATRTDLTLPRWHREQAFLPGRCSRALWGACRSPAPPRGGPPCALSPATQKSPGASPQGICLGRVKSAPSGTAALPAGAWAAPPPGSRCRPPPRRSTR